MFCACPRDACLLVHRSFAHVMLGEHVEVANRQYEDKVEKSWTDELACQGSTRLQSMRLVQAVFGDMVQCPSSWRLSNLKSFIFHKLP